MSPDARNLLQDPQRLTQALRQLSRPAPPVGFTTSLRVAASRERVRLSRSRPQRFYDWLTQLQFSFNNLMRPFALPAAGGLFSAVFLFGTLLVPAYPLRVTTAGSTFDIPTMLTTEAAVRGTVPVGVGSATEAVVDVIIDEQGRMVDYRIVAGGAGLSDKVLRRRLENTLIFTEFFPATTFGRPLSTSVVRVSFGLDSRIEVKG